MEKVENGLVVTQVTQTDLSDWSGAPVEFCELPVDALEIGDDRVVVDYMDYALRGYDLLSEGYGINYLAYGPASSPLKLYHLTKLMQNSVTFNNMLKFFEGVAYDTVEFRLTTSNPKGLAGGFICGIYPHVPWSDQPFSNITSHYELNAMTRQHLMLAPQSQLMAFGEAKDVVFDVPWQYNVPYLPREYILKQDDSSSTKNLWPGTPVLFIVDVGSNFVSSQALPAQIKVFVRFKNLRFSGPSVIDPTLLAFDDLESQSGMEPLGMMAMAGLEQAATKAGQEILNTFIPSEQEPSVNTNDKGTYEDPQGVQMSYIGDSTKVGPPSTTPIFRKWGNTPDPRKIMDLISQPQYLQTIDTGVDKTLYSNPTAPRQSSDITGSDQCCTYLRFFSQFANYWRGTLIFDFVIMGHPMVEVAYSFQVLYPPWSTTLTTTYSENSILKGICSGVYRVQVPMPFMSLRDHLPIVDAHGTSTAVILNQSSSMLKFRADVVSTALDQAPIIPIAIFIRAGPDFNYLQPMAVGLGYVAENNLLAVDDFLDLEAQCGLPEASEVFQTRARVIKPTNQMFPIESFYDIMSIWSRALPYKSYDTNDEPVIDIVQSVYPYWYPMNDASASYTLDVNNSWWVTNDYVSLLSSMFLYYKGSLGFKILTNSAAGGGYRYLTLSSGFDYRQQGHNPFTSTGTLPPKSNFGFGSVATIQNIQPVLELTVPLRASFEWSFTNPLQTVSFIDGFLDDVTSFGSISTNTILHTAGSNLKDMLYRKCGPDFALAVRTLLPPPTLWMAKGYNWS